MGKVRVSNGKETLEIDGGDLNAAVSDGYKPTQRIIVANSKTKETYEVDPNDVAHALKDGFTYSDIAKQSAESRQPAPQPAFHIDISQPTFKSAPANIPTRQFTDEPQGHPLDFIKKAYDAKDRLTAELHTNDAQYEKSVRQSRSDNFTLDKLIQEYRNKGVYVPMEASDLPEYQMALKEAKQREYNRPVTAEDIASRRKDILNNPSESARFIKDLNKPTANKDAYRVAAFNDVANDPEGENRIHRIEKNAEKIGKGEYTYDPETGVFGKPEGFVNSLFSGRNELNKSFDDYSYFKEKPDASVTDRLNTILKNSLDEPVSVPKNKFAEYGKMAAGQPVKGLLAGAIAGGAASYFGNPEAAPTAFQLASAGVSAIDMYKVGYRNALISNYARFKQKGLSDQEALNQARPLAEDQANTDAATAAVMGVAAGKMAFTPTGITLNSLKKGLGSALTQIGEAGAKKALEGFGVGAIGGVGQIVKNVQATQAGLPTDIVTGVKDQIEAGVVLSAATHLAAKSAELLKPATLAKIITPLAKMPPEMVENNLNMQEKEGHITPEQSQRVKDILNEQRLLEGSIPDDLPGPDRVKIASKIDQRNYLNKQLEKLDEAYHPEIKEQIKKLNEDIIAISKGSERGELQTLINKEINKNNVHGAAVEMLRNATEKELQEHMKEIAEQAADPYSEQHTIQTFGEEIVNKAKEIYPDIISTEPIGTDISNPIKEAYNVIKEGRHGGDILLPELNSKDKTASIYKGNKKIESFDLTDIEVEKLNKTKSTKERLELKKEIADRRINEIDNEIRVKGLKESPKGVEVSEHGEDTKTAAGQENGIQESKLSDDGLKEAKELGKYVVENNKNKIVTSDVERAKQTGEEAAKEAKQISGKDIPVENNKVLNTWDIGEYDGKPEGSFNEAEWTYKPNEAPVGGESFNDFTKRMEQANEYIKSLPGDTHVVSHSKVMRALEALKQTGGKWTDETTQLFLNNKELTNAIQEPSTSSVLQHTQEGVGGEGGERGGMEPGEQGEVPARTRPEEESKGTGEEKVAELKVDEAYGLPFIEEPGDKKTGIKNVISKTTRFERQLPKVEVDKLGSDQQIIAEGKDLVDNGVINPLEVVNRILDTKGGMEPNEAKAMLYYMHQLAQHETNLRESLAHATNETERAEINGQIQQLSDEVDAATQANIISGKAWSDVGNIRQIVIDNGFNASRDLATIKEAYGGKIPKEVQDRLNKITKERDEALNNLAKLQAEEKTKSAEDTIKKEGAPKNTKKTKEDFKNERSDIKKSISDKLKKGRSGESGLTAVPLPFAKELIEISPEIFKLIKSYAEEGVQKTEEVINRLHDVLKDEIQGIQKADIVNLLAGRYKTQGEEVSPIAQRIRDFRTQANIWTKIAEATKMEEDTPAKREEKNQKLKDLRDRLNEIRTKNKEAVKSIEDILTSDAQKELKKLEQRRKAAQSQLKNKKYLLPQEKKNTPLTNAIIREKQRIINANYKIRSEKRRAFESQKNIYQKGLMWMARMTRLSILSGYGVLGKLAAASTIGGAGKRIPEQAIGYIYGQIFRGIAEKAPIEGMTSAAAEAKFYKEFFNPKTFAKNAWQILKSGESPLSKQFSQGQFEHIPGLYLPTDLHQIIKDPLKRATYEASFKNGLAWAEKNGLDINDELVIQSIQNAAYKRAQYEIFQESNALTKKFGEFRAAMEKKGNIGATGRAIVDFMIPVSSVPTNIARRLVTTSPAGLIRGGAKVIEAYRKGIENLTPEEADAVMKQLKQGTLGTALWMIGWFGFKSFGGLYSKFNPNKERDEGELASDEMSVDGKMVPKPVQHALPLEIIQFAATARRVFDNYRDNKDASTPEAIEKAGLASIGALTEQIPVVETVAHAIGAFSNPYEAKKLEEEVVRRVQPQILKETGIIKGKEGGGSGGGAGASGHYSKGKPSKSGGKKYGKHSKH